MSPAHRAAAVPSHAGFTADLAAHLLPGGVVVSTPEFFVMARPVRRDAADDDLLNACHRWEDPDAWMVWLAAGDLRAAMAMLWPLFGGGKSWLAFQTRGQPLWVRAVLVRTLYGKRQTQQREGRIPAAGQHAAGPAGQ